MIADPTFWAFVALVMFVGVAFFMKVPQKIAIMLDERADKIAAELETARRLREEAQELLLEFQKKSKEVEKEAAAILEIARKDAKNLIKEGKEKTEKFILHHTLLVEKKIEQEEYEAIQEIRASIIKLALEKAKKSFL